MFIKSFTFRADISKPNLLGFIGSTAPDFYFFLVPIKGSIIYGHIMSEEVMEYLTNEFPVNSLEIIKMEKFQELMHSGEFKQCGTKELIPL